MAGYPGVPEDRLAAGGWEQLARTKETLFRAGTTAVVGRTLVYDDGPLRTALAAADTGELLDRLHRDVGDRGQRLIETGGDDPGSWRFFFATRLSFTPPLAPGIGPASMQSTVVREARQSFANDLAARGFVDISRGRGQRFRTTSGDRGRLTKVTATLPLDEVEPSVDPLTVEGWLAVWAVRGSFRVAGGAYPVSGLPDLLAGLDPDDRPATDPGDFREELLDILRRVE